MVIRCREFSLSEKTESAHEESPNNVAVIDDQENKTTKKKEAQNKLWDENPAGKNKVAAGNFSDSGGGLNPPLKTAVFKITMPCKCDGCALKLKKSIRNLSGVEDVIRAEYPGKDMITVTGKLELAKVQETIEQMTRNKAELFSFRPKIDIVDSVITGNDDIKFDKKSEKKLEQVKGEIINKELQQQQRMVTAVFKINLHCEGCTKKVKKAVHSLEGVKGVNADIGTNKLMVFGKIAPEEMRALLERMFKTHVVLLYPHTNNKPSQIIETMVDATENGDKKMHNNLEKTDVKVVEDHKPKVQELKESNGKAQQNGKVIIKIDGVDSMSIDGAKNVVKLRGTLMSMNVQDLGSTNIKDNKEINEKDLGLIVPYKDAQRTTNMSNNNGDHERLLSTYIQRSYLTSDQMLSLITNNKNIGPMRQKIEATGAGGDVIEVKVKVVNNWYLLPPPPPPPPPNMWESGGYIMSQPDIRYMDHQIFSDENPNSCRIM